MHLKNNAFDLFQNRFGKRFTKEWIENPKKYDDFNISIETLSLCLREEPKRFGKVLEAHIRWCNSFEDERIKEFPCTIDGVKQACRWLDEQRLSFIEKLL